MKISFSKSIISFGLGAAFSLIISAHAVAEVSVIVHPSVNETASLNDIGKLFLGKSKSLPGGTKAVPINLETGTPAREEFNATILKKSDSQLKSYWSRLVFTGKAQPPKDVGSEAEVIELIRKNPNMVGYVSSGSVSPDVKVIATF